MKLHIGKTTTGGNMRSITRLALAALAGVLALGLAACGSSSSSSSSSGSSGTKVAAGILTP
ncbi:MAG TPA: hypothetical protein VF380_02355, partial [Solirubrobacteraceae bacterium]